MKSILREELRTAVLNNVPIAFSEEEANQFIESIDKLPLELVRQFLSRFLELKTTATTIRLDVLSVISQQTE